MPLPLRLLSTDFDGTLYAESEDPPVPGHLQALIARLQARGLRWVVNTGRDWTTLSEALARHPLAVQPDYLVLVEREIHVRNGAGYMGLADWNERCALDHAWLFAQVQPDVPRLAAWVRARFDARVYEDAYSPLCLLATSLADAEAIEAYLTDYCRQVPNLAYMRNDVYARFCHAAYDKGSALGEISRRLQIPPAQVLAAGDHLNDLPMLSRRYARWLAAPANAVPAVKAAVARQQGYVSPLPHGHAVAAALAACWAGRFPPAEASHTAGRDHKQC